MQFSDGKPSAGQNAAHHDSDAEPQPEEGNLGVIGQVENAQAPRLEVDLHGCAANPEESGAQKHSGQSGSGCELLRMVFERGQIEVPEDGGVGWRSLHEKIEQE